MIVLFTAGSTNPAFIAGIQTPLATLNSGFPSFTAALNTVGFKGLSNCGFLDGGCYAGNVASATLFAGAIFLWIGQLLFTILNMIGAFIFLIVGITNFLNNASGGIPFIGYIFDAFIVMMLSSLAALIRGHIP